MICRTGLAPWGFESPFQGSLTFTFLPDLGTACPLRLPLQYVRINSHPRALDGAGERRRDDVEARRVVHLLLCLPARVSRPI